MDRDDVAAGGPGAGFAAAGAVVVVEHPPTRDRVADLDDAAAHGAALDVGALALDPGELSGLATVVVFADEHLDLWWELWEAAVEVAGDPVLPAVGHAVGRLGGVVALVVAEEHDLGPVILAAQQPGLVLLAERTPEVGAAIRPALGFEAPAAVEMAFEPYEGAVVLVPGAVFESVGVARSSGDLGADAEVCGVGSLAAAGGELVDVAPKLVGAHAGAGVCHRQLAHLAGGGLEALPVQVPDHATASGTGLRGDGVEPVDGELTQELEIAAFAA